ncbi:hypothetical protein M426DRAFT_64553 [Hypoxylon sp. CI-4A]|nr:hypothetical protein M426DRAFT_64553 [Hypoxylon sp. CI-4A]
MASESVDSHTTKRPGGLRLSLIMFGLCLAIFLTGMDTTILSTATPIISNKFNALDDIAWWSNAYPLTLSSFQLFYGTLYSIFPIKFIYLFVIALFEIGLLVCITVFNSVALIVGRAIAGFGAAGIFSGGILITTKLIDLSRRVAYLGIMSGVFGLAAIVGPLLGGALVDRSTWRWCFGINLPLGAVTIVLCAILVRLPEEPGVRPKGLVGNCKEFDIMGTLCMVGSLICLLIALQWGGSTYPWNNPRIIALFVVFGVLFIAFVFIQSTSIFSKSRTLPASLLHNRDVWLAAGYAMCLTGGMYVAVPYIPVWFQAIRGYSALSSGVMLIPTIAGYVVSSIIAGGLTSAIGYYNPAMIVGTALSISGAALLTRIDAETSTARIVGYQLLYGFGIGSGFGQPSYIVQTLLPPCDVPVGVTFITLVQNLSASVFVAVGQSIFQSELRSRLQSILPNLDVSSTLDAGASNFLSSIPPENRNQASQAYSTSLILTLYIPLALSCMSIVGALGIRWRSMKVASSHVVNDTVEQIPVTEEGVGVESKGEPTS